MRRVGWFSASRTDRASTSASVRTVIAHRRDVTEAMLDAVLRPSATFDVADAVADAQGVRE
jgi:hypothetical protein